MNRLAQEPPPGSAALFSRYFFPTELGFFMVVVDVGQLFRCAALLNTLYKIVATHAAKHLYEISSFYGLIHKTQFGGLPNRRCSDHIF